MLEEMDAEQFIYWQAFASIEAGNDSADLPADPKQAELQEMLKIQMAEMKRGK